MIRATFYAADVLLDTEIEPGLVGREVEILVQEVHFIASY